MTDLTTTPAWLLAQRIRSGDLDPRELLAASLARIDSDNGAINAVVALDPDGAERRSTEVSESVARGEDPGPLAGLPVLVKDLEDVVGMPTTLGTSLLRTAPAATQDSVHVARLRAAGAVIFGKTNTPPFGITIFTTNNVFGVTRNPWDLTQSPAGSSGGSAAAVAAGFAPLATGGDGGGSTRLPAALCGLPGLKTTRGLIPLATPGQPPDARWTNNAVLTPMTRTVADIALHLDVTVGLDPGDPMSIPAVPPTYRDALREPGRPLRIVVDRTLGLTDPDDDALAAVEQCIEVLRRLGHEIVDRPRPAGGPTMVDIRLRQQVMAYTRTVNLRQAVATHRDELEPWIVESIEWGEEITRADLERYWTYRGALGSWVPAVLDGVDVLLTPTTPLSTWPAEGLDMDEAGAIGRHPMALTALFNDTGHPALAMPVGVGSTGIPSSVQLVAAHHHDRELLQLGAAIEEQVGSLSPSR